MRYKRDCEPSPSAPHFQQLTSPTALRLYPQLPVNVRDPTKTTMLPRGGSPDGQSPVLVPRGTGIGYSVYNMHRHLSLLQIVFTLVIF